ncbi:hypothetical protein AB4099_18830 [Bosea sp. 2KB_26]|uniref:hypothetical protein n=1 Tax=Bosea sp. 2KB_26 TaxID=3237475 RepID=UPI003F8F0797
MAPITYFVPAVDLNEARDIAYAVDAGRLKYADHYRSEEAAERICQHFRRLGCTPRRVFPIIIDRTTTHDGSIPVARLVDSAGEIAAVLVLFAMGAAVGFASMLEVFA